MAQIVLLRIRLTWLRLLLWKSQQITAFLMATRKAEFRLDLAEGRAKSDRERFFAVLGYTKDLWTYHWTTRMFMVWRITSTLLLSVACIVLLAVVLP